MTASRDLGRRLTDHLLGEAPSRAPDWVLQSALSTIESIPQRRGMVALRRYPSMSTYTKLAAAAVAVLAVGGIALWQLAPPLGPGATDAPPVTAVPTVRPTTAPTARPEPTTYVPGALTQTFTSDLNGFSLSYPQGWVAERAREPWAAGALPIGSEAAGDRIRDATLGDHLFLTVVSRPLDGASLDAWFTEHLGDQGCTPRTGGTVSGADLVLRGDCDSDIAMASSGGRGYVFVLRVSPDDVELRTLDSAALLDAILATVHLLPEDAVDE